MSKKVYTPITFTLSAKQVEKFEKWRKKKNKKNCETYDGVVGGSYTFCFTPTGIGTIDCVKCTDGEELDLTDFNNW